VRRRLKFALADLLYYSGFTRLWRRMRAPRQVCVVGLHRVLEPEERAASGSQDGIILTRENFSALLQHLKQNFTLLPASELIADGTHFSAGGKPSCAITFDDGWLDNYTTAFPLLRREQVPATIFLVSDFVAGEPGLWVKQLRNACRIAERGAQIRAALGRLMEQPESDLQQQIEWLKHRPARERAKVLEQVLSPEERRNAVPDRMFGWEQAREMAAQGIEFGSHTRTHPLLTFETDADIECELRESKQALEQNLGRPIQLFAYPNGDWDDRVRELVRRAGYATAFGTRIGWHRAGDDPYGVRRILLHDGNVSGNDGKFSPAVLEFTLLGWRG